MTLAGMLLAQDASVYGCRAKPRTLPPPFCTANILKTIQVIPSSLGSDECAPL